METKPKKRLELRASYHTYMMLGFAVVSLATAVIIIGVVALVFNSYFTSYTSGNMESVAVFAADRVADEYEDTHSLDAINYDSLIENLQIDDNVGIMVFDRTGEMVYESKPKSSLVTSQGETSDTQMPDTASQVAVSDIITDNDDSVGSVRLWIYGSDALMSKLDIEFRNNTYHLLLIAGALAVIIAILLGFLFSRTLVKPLNHIFKATQQLTEGDLSVRTGMKGANEIDQLGEAFDYMAQTLERNRKQEVQLTSDVAHELRTPLMSIQSNVEAMIDGVYEADRENLVLVESEVKRLSRLVDALLRLSRLEMRSQPLNMEVNDIGEIVESIVASHEIYVRDSGLDIESHVIDPVSAFCDKDKVRQAIVNLISNAVRYTPEGGRIDVYVRKENGLAIIDVSDTGIGLTPEEEQMVFSRFWRADAGRKQDSGGLGIGLSIVKEIVDQHGGRMGVHGEKGVGSTFTIMLPAYEEEPAAPVRGRGRILKTPEEETTA